MQLRKELIKVLRGVNCALPLQGLSVQLVCHGLCSSLERDTHPAGVRLDLATAGNHVALIGFLFFGFFFFWGVSNKVMSVQQKIEMALQVFFQGR